MTDCLHEDWNEVPIIQEWVYKVHCKRCDLLITIIQKGKPVNEDMLNTLLNEVHITNCYNSLWRFDKTTNIQLDLDILNRPCFIP